MIYEFLYKNKPMSISTPIIMFIITILWGITYLILCLAHLKHVNKDAQVYTIIIYATLTIIFSLPFLASLTIYTYDKITTPSKNTKATELYQITKEKDYLTFTAKKPYNHLYKTKTIEIAYEDSKNYVIIKNEQTYKIPKEVVKE